MFTCSGSYRSGRGDHEAGGRKQKSLSPATRRSPFMRYAVGGETIDVSQTRQSQQPAQCSSTAARNKVITVEQSPSVFRTCATRQSPNIIRACLNDLVHNASGDSSLLNRAGGCSTRRNSSGLAEGLSLVRPARLSPTVRLHTENIIQKANHTQETLPSTSSGGTHGAIDYSFKVKTEPRDEVGVDFGSSSKPCKSVFKMPSSIYRATCGSGRREVKLSKKENCKNILKVGKSTQLRFSGSYDHRLKGRCVTLTSPSMSGASHIGGLAGEVAGSSTDIHLPPHSSQLPTPTLRSDRTKHMQLSGDLINMISSFTNPQLIPWLEYFTSFCEMNRRLLSDIHFSNLQTLYQRLAETVAQPIGLLLIEENFDKCVGISRRLQSIINQYLVSFMAKK